MHKTVPVMLRLGGAVLAGLVLDVAFPPHDLWWLAPVAVGLLTALCRGQSADRGALLGLATGLGFFVPLLVWTGTIAGPAAWLALALLESAFLVPLGAALALVTRRAGWPVWAACLWVGEEALRDRLPFGGFPWGRLAFSQGHTVLTPLAAVGGAPLVTAGVALLGGLVAAVVVRAGLRPAAAAAAVTLLVAALVPTPTDGRVVTVAVVQGNVPRLGLAAFAQRAAVLNNHAAATHELAAEVRAGRLARPDLVVWPENASDLDPYTDAEAAAIIDAAVRDVGVPVLVGAVLDGPGNKIRNAGIVWDPVAGPGERYIKRHPVPFGEYMPFRSVVRRISRKVDLVPRDFAHGDRPGVLQVGPARLADVICFEVAYDGVVRDAIQAGGRLLVVQTNNATFGRTGETYQQLAMGRLRAVEHGRSVLVAATSGISAVIAPDGRLVRRSPVFRRDLLVQRVTLRDSATLASRLGVLPELLLAALGAAAVVAAARVRP
jgi:apolipoprotein N-acyltransferase